MNTVDSLRATLESHAAIGDPGALARPAALHRRIQVVRRRRRIATAVGAVAAVLALVAGVALPRVLAGHGRPELAAAPTVTAGGFEYRLVKVVEGRAGQRMLRVDAPQPGAHEALALLARHLDGGYATLAELPDAGTAVAFPPQDLDRLARDGQDAALPLPRGAEVVRGYQVTVHGGGAHTRVGVGVYQRTMTMPAGRVDPTRSTVFRQTIGSQHLLAAAFAKPGQAEVSFRFSGRLDQTVLGGFCGRRDGESSPGRSFVNVSVDGSAAVSSTGCQALTEDAWSGGFTSQSPAGGEHTVRVWTSETRGGPVSPVRGVVLGGAAYDDSAAIVINGNRIDPTVERDGRTWTLDHDLTLYHHGTSRSLAVAISTGPDPILFGFAVDHLTRLSATSEDTVGGASSFASAVGTPSSSLGPIGLAESNTSYTVSWPAKDSAAQVAILVYRAVD